MKREIIEKLRALKPRARAHKAELVALIELPDPEDPQPRLWILARFLPTASLFDLLNLSDMLEKELGIKVEIVSEKAVENKKDDLNLIEI